MRSNLFLFSCFLLLCFTSCQKSIEWNDLVLTPTTPTTPITPGGGTTISSLLDKVVSLTTTDTSTQTFSYDASKKLVKVTNVGISSGDKVDDTYLFTRDASGKVTNVVEIVYSVNSLNASGYDTTYATIHYPTGSSSFDYSINTLTSGGITYRDSSSYTYTSNKVTSAKAYTFNIVSGKYEYSNSKDYTYDANGNVLTLKVSTSPSNPLGASLDGDYKFEYDSKNSPLVLGNEAIITLGETYCGANNVNKLTLNITSPQTGTLVLNLAYNYNVSNYPTYASGAATFQGMLSNTQSATYFYK